MFFTYLRRELRRRRKAAMVVAMGLALGIGLVITVTSVSAGMKSAQSQVLHNLYGVGTDITVTKAATTDSQGAQGPQRFNFSQSGTGSKSTSQDRLRVMGGTGTLTSAQLATIAKQSGVSAAVGGLSLNDTKFNGSFSFHGGTSGSSSSGGSGFRGGFGGSSSGQKTPSAPPSGSAGFSLDSFTVDGVDTSDLSIGPMSALTVTSGSTFTSAQSSSAVAILDSSYASTKKLKVGSTLTISGTTFKVIGIATASSGSSTANVYIPLTEAQTLSDNKNAVSTVYVKATDSQQISAVKSAIQKNVSGTTVTTSSDLASEVSGSLSTASSLATSLGKWLSIAVLIAAFLVAALLTSSAVNRRVREFGTLKALGWRSKRVIGQVMGEAVVNGLIGGVVGIVLGVGAASVISAVSPSLSATLDPANSVGGGRAFGGGAGGAGGAGGGFSGAAGGGNAFRSAAHAVSVHLTAPVTATAIILAVVLAVAGGLIAGGFGGWRASRLRPADALRRVE